MNQATMGASLGDDVFEEDLTVNLPQETAAAMLGFEAALFAPSGTQSSHYRDDDELPARRRSHHRPTMAYQPLRSRRYGGARFDSAAAVGAPACRHDRSEQHRSHNQARRPALRPPPSLWLRTLLAARCCLCNTCMTSRPWRNGTDYARTSMARVSATLQSRLLTAATGRAEPLTRRRHAGCSKAARVRGDRRTRCAVGRRAPGSRL